MARFFVPTELSPGVARAGVGFFEIGDILTLPDAASVSGDFVHPKLVPLDDEAMKMLLDDDKRRRDSRAEQNKERGAQSLPLLPPWPKYAPAAIPSWAKAGAPPPTKPTPAQAAQTLAQVAAGHSDGSVATALAQAPFEKGQNQAKGQRAADR